MKTLRKNQQRQPLFKAKAPRPKPERVVDWQSSEERRQAEHLKSIT